MRNLQSPIVWGVLIVAVAGIATIRHLTGPDKPPPVASASPAPQHSGDTPDPRHSPDPGQVALLIPTPMASSSAVEPSPSSPVTPVTTAPETGAPSPSPSPESPATPLPPPPPPLLTPAERGAALDRELRAGVAALRGGRPEQAVERLRRAHQLEPSDSGVLAFLRQAERAVQGKSLTAEQRVERDRAAANERTTQLGRYRAALAAKDPQTAGGILARLQSRYPDDRDVIAARPALEAARQEQAQSLLYERRVAAWRNELGRAAALEPTKPAEALAVYRSALALFPNDPYSAGKIKELEARLARPSVAPVASPKPSTRKSTVTAGTARSSSSATPRPSATSSPKPSARKKKPVR